MRAETGVTPSYTLINTTMEETTNSAIAEQVIQYASELAVIDKAVSELFTLQKERGLDSWDSEKLATIKMCILDKRAVIVGELHTYLLANGKLSY